MADEEEPTTAPQATADEPGDSTPTESGGGGEGGVGEITQELDTNYLDYTDPITDPGDDPATTEHYLKGEDLPDPTALARFRERWPSLAAAPSGGGA